MNETVKHIEYLLMTHDCVAVPGLGAFMSHYVQAQIDSELGCVFPPRRVLSFNRELHHDDGLLCSSVARRCKISFEEARVDVDNDVADMLSQLRAVGEVGVGNLGVIKNTRGGRMEFVPNERYCTAPALSSLQPVAVGELTVDESLKIVRRRSSESMAFRMVSIAASLLLLIMIGVGLTTDVIPDNALKAAIGRLPMMTVEKPVDIDFNPAIDLAIAEPDPTASVAEMSKAIDYSGLKYTVVVASLVNDEQAREFIASSSIDGVDYSVVDSGSRCRVVVDGGDDLTSLTGRLLIWRQTFPQAWIYQQK